MGKRSNAPTIADFLTSFTFKFSTPKKYDRALRFKGFA